MIDLILFFFRFCRHVIRVNGIVFFVFLLFYLIHKTRETVFHRDIKTPGEERVKNTRAAEYF